MKNDLNAIVTIAARDFTKLLRDKVRILSSFIFPIIFIGVLGTSLQSNLQRSLPYNFLTFVFLGVLAQTLFQSTASGIISLVEDRQNDFAQEMFISPISRHAIILGKIVGETLVSFIQVFGILAFGYIIGIPLSFTHLARLIPFSLLVAAFGGSFGLLVMANKSAEAQAQCMSEYAGIHLTEGQVTVYTRLRELTPSNNEEHEGPPEPWKLNDQALLDTVLEPGQQLIFRSKYPNIFGPELCIEK